ncbi:MAG: DsbA family protein [Desulfocapsa sp.]|nr:DsbA family protein [Desulfocapsa sp.]
MPLLEQVLEHNPDTVKIVLKNMPLGFHKEATPAALAALAAGNQGKYWEFHDALFDAPKLSTEVINDIAVQLGLNIEQFTKDMNSPQIRQKLIQDLNDAKEAGVTGTPTIFINGTRLKDRNLPAIQAIIDKELGKKAN